MLMHQEDCLSPVLKNKLNAHHSGRLKKQHSFYVAIVSNHFFPPNIFLSFGDVLVKNKGKEAILNVLEHCTLLPKEKKIVPFSWFRVSQFAAAKHVTHFNQKCSWGDICQINSREFLTTMCLALSSSGISSDPPQHPKFPCWLSGRGQPFKLGR